MVLRPISGWVLQGFLGGSPFFSASNRRNAVEFEKIWFSVYVCTCLGFSWGSLWFSVHCVVWLCKVLFGFFSVSKGSNAVESEIYGFLLSLRTLEAFP